MSNKEATLFLTEEEIHMIFLALIGHIAGLFGMEEEQREAIDRYQSLRTKIDTTAQQSGIVIR